MRNYNRITKSLQRTADQLTELQAVNAKKAAAQFDRIQFIHRVIAKIVELRDRLVAKLHAGIAELDAEAVRAGKTAKNIAGLLT